MKILTRIAYLVRSKSSCLHNRTRRRLVIPAAVVGDAGGTGILSRKDINRQFGYLSTCRYEVTSIMALEGRSPELMAAEGKTGSSGGSSVWQPRETFLGPTSGLEREPLFRDISSMSRRPCIGKDKSFLQVTRHQQLHCLIQRGRTLFSVTSLDLISSSLARNPSSIWMDCDITPAISIILSVLSCNNCKKKRFIQ